MWEWTSYLNHRHCEHTPWQQGRLQQSAIAPIGGSHHSPVPELQDLHPTTATSIKVLVMQYTKIGTHHQQFPKKNPSIQFHRPSNFRQILKHPSASLLPLSPPKNPSLATELTAKHSTSPPTHSLILTATCSTPSPPSLTENPPTKFNIWSIMLFTMEESVRYSQNAWMGTGPHVRLLTLEPLNQTDYNTEVNTIKYIAQENGYDPD